MNRAIAMSAAAAICAAAGAALFSGALPRAKPFAEPFATLAAAGEGGATIYYRDPDGKPLYSLTPKKTPDGRDWRAVPANADVSFEEPDEPPAEIKSAEVKTERKIKY